jgi:NitT/TauT family transport system ATP-binding protein
VSSTTRSSETLLATRDAGSSVVDVTRLSKRLGSPPRPVLAGVSLQVGHHEVVAIVGPSGAGKSTLLNVVAGLLTPDAGEARVGGHRVSGPQPSVGYLTQKDTLFPWRTALANVELPLQIRGEGKRSRRERAMHLLGLVGLADAAGRYPSQLSGGMRRRAALARMLIADPEVLLLDEPFSALDAQLRVALQAQLVELLERLQRPALLVTHDLEEAAAVADRVLVLRGHPASIAAEVRVPFERPREVRTVRFQPAFQQLQLRLWEEIADGRAPAG